ncbi:hypothetical protein HYU10_04795, partial [Candidatus Woesearchaeota archaeon]|nr:hypothetical protein [Candidatus Woesearchaeota archaeon]
IFTQMVVSAGISYCFGLVQSLRGGKGSIKNLYNAVNPFPYASATYSIGTRAARNAFSYSTTGMYGLGGGIREFFSGLASKPKAAPGPEKKQESRPEANAHYQKAPSEESGKLLNFPSEKARQYERKYEKKAA